MFFFFKNHPHELIHNKMFSLGSSHKKNPKKQTKKQRRQLADYYLFKIRFWLTAMNEIFFVINYQQLKFLFLFFYLYMFQQPLPPFSEVSLSVAVRLFMGR